MAKPRKRRVFAAKTTKKTLALAPQAVGADYSARASEPEPVGTIAMLCIDGPPAHKDDGWFDNYESIQDRFVSVIADPAVEAIILKFDSPGGDVAGLFETVKTMRAAKTKPVYAYIDEACYSAAYAMAMVADEIYLPASGGVGSVGVITCMVDISAANEAAGVRVEVVTSGNQKADGHPDVPLTDDAIKRTQAKVDDLAGMFFDLVANSRGLSTEVVKGFQAGTFLGQDAVDAGLADGVMSFNELLKALSTDLATSKETTDMGKLAAIREENEKAEKLAASLPAEAEVKFKHTKKMVEVIESEDDPSAKDEEDEDDETEEEEDKEKDAKALLALARKLTGKRSGKNVMGALLAMAEAPKREASMAQRLAALEAERAQDRVSALVEAGIRDGKLSPGQKCWAASLDAKTLKGYLDATPKMVRTLDEPIERAETPTEKRKATPAMLKMWGAIGLTKPADIEAALANMPEKLYRKLENK